MARTRLYIILISLTLLSSACSKKAKMRTVPRQNPSATTGIAAAPSNPPPPSFEENPAPVAPKAPEGSAPTPTPSSPVVRLEEPGDTSGDRRPAPAPRRPITTTTDDGELNRPRPRPRLPRPAPRQAPRQEVVVGPDDCIPVQREERRVEPPPAPRARPVREREERVERRNQFELDATDELHCRWEPTGKPMTYLKYDPATKTAYVQHGWPQKWSKYTNVRLVTGLAPYREEGLSMVTKAGVPIAHLKPTGNGTIWYERGTSYPYESYFGQVPGAPQGEAIRGVCWTKSEPAKQSEGGNSGGNGG